MRELRSRDKLAPLFKDVRSAIPEAIRSIYYTDPARRNVRIRDSYATAEYWDGRDWWVIGIGEAVDAVVEVAIDELEHCVDWSDSVPDQAKLEFETFVACFRSDPSVREGVRQMVVDVMIRPFGDAAD